MKYRIIKTAYCGMFSYHHKVGSVKYSNLDINAAHFIYENHIYPSCSCKAIIEEVKEQNINEISNS